MGAIVGLENELTFWPGGTTGSSVSFTLNAATDAWEVIFQAHEDMTITRLGLRQGTVTGTSPVYKISLQGVADGIPDGTILGGGSPASTTFTPVAGGNGTWQWKTLDNSIAVTRGQWLAAVIARDSGTIDGSNNCSFTSTMAFGRSPAAPYGIQNDAGSRTRQSATPVFGYGSAGTAYGRPALTSITSTFNSGSAADERAIKINIPTTWWSTYKIIGAVIYGTNSAATAYDLVLYDSDGTTVLQTINLDTDNDQGATSSRGRPVLFDESALSTLNAGSAYYLSVKPGATNQTVIGFTVDATADLDAYFGGAAICQGATKVDGGSFTDSNITRYGINPIIADITAPSGSGVGNRSILGAGVGPMG